MKNLSFDDASVSCSNYEGDISVFSFSETEEVLENIPNSNFKPEDPISKGKTPHTLWSPINSSIIPNGTIYTFILMMFVLIASVLTGHPQTCY